MHQPLQGAAPLPAPPERLANVEEVADLLQLTPSTVRRLARNGSLPSLKVGRSVRFRLSEVIKHLEGPK